MGSDLFKILKNHYKGSRSFKGKNWMAKKVKKSNFLYFWGGGATQMSDFLFWSLFLLITQILSAF